jgi:endonuclease/exonuclease/phosphatase family metal-dependent hydrolase
MKPRSISFVFAVFCAAGAISASAVAQNAPATKGAPQTSAPAADLIRFGVKDLPAKAAGTIRFAAWNVENFFDDKDDAALSGQFDDKDATKSVAHVQALAENIKRLDADIIALQEIENRDMLVAFRDQYLSGLGYDFVSSIDAGDSRGIENAVLSRFPLSGEQVWVNAPLEGVHIEEEPREGIRVGDPITLRRSPLRVTVTIPAEKAGGEKAYDVTLFVVHHKSGRQFDYWREAEAAKVTSLAKAEIAGGNSRVIVLGDFNALPRAASVQTYITGGLVDVLGDQDTSKPQWITHESGRAIDHILATPDFEKDVVTEFIMGIPARPAGSNWRTTPPPAGYVSDHYPVVVDIKPNHGAAKDEAKPAEKPAAPTPVGS